MAEATIAKVKCLVPDCDGDVKTRGLCKKCLAMFYSNVRNGEATWEQLEELGLAKKPTGERKGRFKKILEAALAAQGKPRKKRRSAGEEEENSEEKTAETVVAE